MASYNSPNKGFTLIELLVVISIISLLTSGILAAITSAREKARDVRRVQEINSLIETIDRYFQDNNRPPGQDDVNGTHIDQDCDNDIKSDLAGKGYYSIMPTDPGGSDCSDNSNNAQFYGWDSSRCGENYCISINTLETEWALETLSEKYGYPISGGKVRDQTCGGQANIDQADFNHCFADEWGL